MMGRVFAGNEQGFQPTIGEVAAFLNTQQLGRVATLGPDGRPQVANVAFSQNDRLEFLIGTSELSRKARNLQRDGRAAFESTDPDKRYTVQFEGIARKLSMDEFEERAAAHFKKLPGSLPFKDIEGQAYFLLEPSWVRFSDCSVYPWATTEYTFDS